MNREITNSAKNILHELSPPSGQRIELYAHFLLWCFGLAGEICVYTARWEIWVRTVPYEVDWKQTFKVMYWRVKIRKWSVKRCVTPPRRAPWIQLLIVISNCHMRRVILVLSIKRQNKIIVKLQNYNLICRNSF